MLIPIYIADLYYLCRVLVFERSILYFYIQSAKQQLKCDGLNESSILLSGFLASEKGKNLKCNIIYILDFRKEKKVSNLS